MQTPGALLDMPKPKKRPVGRPKMPEPLKSIVAVKASPTYERWLDRLADHVRQPSRANLVRIALEDFAKASGFEPPPER
jgi:hypothetical protein